MDFYTALRCVAEGERIRRDAWPNGLTHVAVEHQELKLIDHRGISRVWVITLEDLSATDWVTTAGG
jgi:hypothetical protein